MTRVRNNYQVIARAGSRKLAPCFRSSSGYLHSRESAPVEYESGLERDFVIQASAHKDFIRAKWNPLDLNYVDSVGQARVYRPDYLVEHALGSDMPQFWLVELKYRSDLRRNLDEWRDRFYAAREYASQLKNWRFNVLTEYSVDRLFVENIRHLNRYRDLPIDTDPQGFAERLYYELRDRGTCTPERLLAACYSCREDQIQAIPSLWAMVAKGIIHCDLRSKLTMTAHIWLAE